MGQTHTHTYRSCGILWCLHLKMLVTPKLLELQINFAHIENPQNKCNLMIFVKKSCRPYTLALIYVYNSTNFISLNVFLVASERLFSSKAARVMVLSQTAFKGAVAFGHLWLRKCCTSYYSMRTFQQDFKKIQPLVYM